MKWRLALCIVSGKRHGEIAKMFGVSTWTLRNWLGAPEVEREIWTLEQELRRRTERQFVSLFDETIKRIRRILRHGDDKAALRATELVWRAQGRLAAGNDEPAIGALVGNQPNIFIHDHEDAQAALELLKRDRAERRSRETITIETGTIAGR